MYLLDTNVCIGLLRKRPARLAERLETVDPAAVALSSVVRAELAHGARTSARVEENLALLARFCSAFVSLPFDDRCAEEYGRIGADLERAGTPIGANDLMIAATARAHDLVLVTHNTREFSRVFGLRLDDWE